VILLDTNVVSELLKAQPHPAVEHWFMRHEESCCLPSVAIAELAYGIAKLPDGVRKVAFQQQLSEWRIRFANRICSFDVSAALVYGDIQALARRAGRPMSVPDAQIAAIAMDQGHQLATRNISDFEATGVELVDPWTA
jgi:predicted nucleic acid-binding protein